LRHWFYPLIDDIQISIQGESQLHGNNHIRQFGKYQMISGKSPSILEKNMAVDKTNLALEEFKLLQATVARQEGIRFQIRSWNIALLTALTVSFVASNSPISKGKYLVASIGLAILFLWLEVIHRVAEDRALRRSAVVEAALRDEIPYDGPQIGESHCQSPTVCASNL
jgi:hypothetical protein